MNYNSGKPEKFFGQWFCPTCEEKVEKTDGFCENCGHEFDWEDIEVDDRE